MEAEIVIDVSAQRAGNMIAAVNEVSGVVKKKILSLQNEFKYMKIFITESEEEVNQIRDAAYRIEDLIDEYGAIVIRQRYRSTWGKLFHVMDYTKRLRRIDVAIERIQRSIAYIHESKDRYGIAEESEVQRGGDDITEGRRVRTARMHVAEDDDEVVGLVEESSAITKQLTELGPGLDNDVSITGSGGTGRTRVLTARMHVAEDDDGVVGLVEESRAVMKQLTESGPGLDVVSIIGPGGTGKTVLAQKVYHNKDVQELFPCRVWLLLSKSSVVKELLMNLLESLLPTSEYLDFLNKRGDHRDADTDMIIRKVSESLSGKKYLVVLDDVWQTSVWDGIKWAFPDDNKGSKILLTTRLNELGSSIGTMPPYLIPVRTEEESWKLFCKEVFGGEDCPPDLIDLGKSLVESCEGLPLAIKVLASIVANREKTGREWSRIKHQLFDSLTSSTKMMDTLNYSYDHLPQRLKPCFLYFGIFPEDHEIPAKELILLWIAEGFISQEETSSSLPHLEDVAKKYLCELVDLNFVQVASKTRDGGVKTYKIHDLLHDLCKSKGNAIKFFEVRTRPNIHGPNNPRKLSIQGTMTEFYLSSNTGNDDQFHTRSLFFFTGENECVDDLDLSGFKFLSVLYIRESLFIKSIPKSLGRMIHLRYLRIGTDDYVGILPDFICNLWNLETLDIRSTKVIAFPSKIWKLKRLRNLLGRIRMSRASHKRRMVTLQTLNYVRLDPAVVSMVKNGLFPNLRKLVLLIEDENSVHVGEQLQSLCNLKNLKKLRIKGNEKLALNTDAFPSSLTNVCLHTFSDMSSSCMKALKELPNLESLKIVGPKVQYKFDLDCDAEDFPMLQEFHMQWIVRRWSMQEGAMGSLRHLTIYDCRHLDKLPEELFSLTTLRLVEIYGPSRKLKTSLSDADPFIINGCKLKVHQ